MASQMSLMLRADPSGFEDGINDAITAIRKWETQTDRSAGTASQALEEAIRGVVTLGRATDQSSDDMKRALRGLGLSAEDAEDALAAIEREAQNVGASRRDIERAEDAVDDLGKTAEDAADETRSISDAAGDVSDSIRSVGDIAKSALEGDFASAAEGAASALSGLAGTLAGGAVGGAIASAIGGIIAGWINEWNRAAEESEKRVVELADRLIEVNGQINESFIMEGAEAYLTDLDKRAEGEKIAAATGMSLVEVARALSGDFELQAEVQRRVTDGIAETNAKMIEEAQTLGEVNDQTLLRSQHLERAAEVLNLNNQEMSNAVRIEQDVAAAREYGNRALYEQATAAGQATGQIDAFGRALYQLPDGKTVVVDAETQRAHELLDDVDSVQIGPKILRLSVDDSEVRNYRPPTIHVNAKVQMAANALSQLVKP